MLDDEEYSSDTSDDDYVPAGADEGDSSVNESEDAEAVSEESDAEDVEGKKGKQKKKKNKKKTIQTNVKDHSNETEIPISSKLDDKRIESLWASFKESSGTTETKDTRTKAIETKPSETSTSSNAQENPTTASTEAKPSAVTAKASSVSSVGAAKRPAPARSGGLADLASRLSGKKPKISTLEKSKLDWDSFKKAEGIEEDLKTFNQGKMGYLERQAFLERADVKQFEIEKGLRLGRKPQ